MWHTTMRSCDSQLTFTPLCVFNINFQQPVEPILVIDSAYLKNTKVSSGLEKGAQLPLTSARRAGIWFANHVHTVVRKDCDCPQAVSIREAWIELRNGSHASAVESDPSAMQHTRPAEVGWSLARGMAAGQPSWPKGKSFTAKRYIVRITSDDAHTLFSFGSSAVVPWPRVPWKKGG